MKNILKYILCFAFCVGVICATTTTVNAEESIYATDLEVGDTFYYDVSCAELHNGVLYEHYLNATWEVTSSNIRNCLYLNSNGLLYLYSGGGVEPLGGVTWYVKNTVNGNVNSFTNQTFINIKPVEYGYDADSTNYFRTNIPIFSSQDIARQYVNGEIDIKSALNYKKSFENGSWVKPFEDIEINDSDILVPDLSNISHEGFTVTNCNNELYVCEIYMESGIEKPENYMNGSLNVDDALFVNSFGLITDNSEAYWNGPTFNIAQLYGIDNYSALMNSVNNFYSSYPSPNSYYSGYKASDNYQIWGRPFNKQGIFFMNSTSVNSNDLIGITPYDIPICYTQYRVRYFYYDDDSGYHYGPWGIYTYFSDGSVSKSGLFQSNTGDIIEIPTTSGIQNESGNVDFNTSNIVDLNNPNELFGYLRSTINNINATGNTFMTLFATLFSFIPIELQIALWLGIACMIFIGVIKSI